MKKMTIANYTTLKGNSCPNCCSTEIFSTDTNLHEDGRITRIIVCQACKSTWTDVYKLTKYIALEVPNVNVQS